MPVGDKDYMRYEVTVLVLFISQEVSDFFYFGAEFSLVIADKRRTSCLRILHEEKRVL